jgi:hypothetical protein
VAGDDSGVAMLFAFYAAIVLIFPCGAAWAWRRRGDRGLALITLAAVSLLVVLALTVASAPGGNRLVQTRGYAYTATQTLRFSVLTLILPVILSAMSVWSTAPRLRPGVVYVIAVATAFIGTVVGTIVAIYSL